MGKMIRKYERMLESGEYSSENELCNALGLNYDDLYEEEAQEDDGTEWGAKRGRYSKPLFGDTKKRR